MKIKISVIRYILVAAILFVFPSMGFATPFSYDFTDNSGISGITYHVYGDTDGIGIITADVSGAPTLSSDWYIDAIMVKLTATRLDSASLRTSPAVGWYATTSANPLNLKKFPSLPNNGYTLLYFDGVLTSTDPTNIISGVKVNGGSTYTWSFSFSTDLPFLDIASMKVLYYDGLQGNTINTAQMSENSTPPVPEPATMLLLGSGLLGLAGFRRKIKK